MQRRILITGAGSGLGLALAHRYARTGARIACVDLLAERASEGAAQPIAAGGEPQRPRAQGLQRPQRLVGMDRLSQAQQHDDDGIERRSGCPLEELTAGSERPVAVGPAERRRDLEP